jgi:hypothetical protein
MRNFCEVCCAEIDVSNGIFTSCGHIACQKEISRIAFLLKNNNLMTISASVPYKSRSMSTGAEGDG